MDPVSTRAFTGPMTVVTWLVAVGWFVLALLSIVGLAAPAGVVLGGLGAVGALSTAWIALSLRIPYDDDGIRLPKLGHVPWGDVHAVEVQPGVVAVPYLVVRRGRALDEVPLDGLAWFGGAEGYTRALAEKVARTAGVDDVTVRVPRGGTGRRAA